MKKEKQINLADYFISIFSRVALIVTVALAVIAVFAPKTGGEASVGSFEVMAFPEGWKLQMDGQSYDIDLPAQVECEKGTLISISNTLPEDLHDGMSLMMRASIEDIYIYIDGKLREEYSTEKQENSSYYLSSAYVVCGLLGEDAGKDIRIDLRVKSKGFLNEVTIGSGNNVWFPIIKNGLLMNLAAAIVLILGIVLLLVASFFSRYLGHGFAAKYLGILMVDVALWVLSESSLRQFIFNNMAISDKFTYIAVELIGVFSAMYFDAVQHQKNHKVYRVLEAVILIQLAVNMALSVLGFAEQYETLVLSHFWTGCAIVFAVISIVRDLLNHSIRSYRITAAGMVCFLGMSIVELAGFYASSFHVFGTFLCIGLLLLMVFTVIQMLVDEMETATERVETQMKMVNNTIETIAGAIDAKDEYTGGHSERVGIYAEMLAREIAADYGLSEEDILRIRYIGQVHDIGKIGVADPVLNKAGRLNDEEFSLMKKHTEIGYEIMRASGESVEGVLDGIRYHHERFDGKGYPDGLSYTDIPLVARILGLADAYDAMTSNRVYRKRLTDEEVRSELLRCSGSQFDPALTTSFVRLLDRGAFQGNTEEGMSTDEQGEILISARLENRLHEDLQSGKEVTNPTHVRMMCYVIKLMEKQKREVSVLFYGLDETFGQKKIDGESAVNTLSEEERKLAWEKTNACVMKYMTSKDMMIRYDSNLNVLALFEHADQLEALERELKESIPGVQCYPVSK